MRVTYVTRSFLDYRLPVLEALYKKLGGQLYVVYSADYVPSRVSVRATQILGDHAIGMTGEKRLGPDEFAGFANTAFRFVYQPGLLKRIKETRPTVLVADGFFQWTSGALLYKWRYRSPLVVCYERTYHTERNAQWIRTAYRRAVVRAVDAMSCNGQLSLEYTTWLGMPESRVTLGHMVADTDGLARKAASIPSQVRQELRKEWGDPSLVFLVVGRLNKRKGVRELLQGWSLLEKRQPNSCRLVLVGTGSDEVELKELASQLQVNSVIFHGAANHNEIATYYSASDLLVSPTLEDNWSLVVPEAMACGLPVLCSKYNGCHPELLRHGENGWVFDPLDREATFRALKTAVDDKLELKKMGGESRRIVASYTPDRAADAILDACRIALGDTTE